MRTAVEDFQELHGRITGVLDVVAKGRRDVADITSLVVEGPSIARRSEERHTSEARAARKVE